MKIPKHIEALVALHGLVAATHGLKSIPDGECNQHGNYPLSRDGVRFLAECPKCYAYKVSKIPDMYRGKFFDDFLVTPEKERAILRAREFIADIKSGRGPILTMSGNYGAGKTLLASIIANESGVPTILNTAHQIISDVRASWRNGAEASLQKKYTETGLLIIDEVKHLGFSEADITNRQILFEIINARWMASKPLIIISNLPAKSDPDGSIQDSLGSDVYDRLRDGKIIRFDWPSMRGMK